MLAPLLNLRVSVRSLRRSPGFAATALLTLALGIGAATSVFSVVNTVLLKPFAFRDPGRLVVLREVEEASGRLSVVPDNYRHYLRLKQNAKTIEDAAIVRQTASSISTNGDRPRIVRTVIASANLLHMLGVQPIQGRDFGDADAARGAPEVVLLSYEGWQTFFNGTPKVVGQTIRIGGKPATVIGVLPPGTRFPSVALSPQIKFQDATEARETMIFRPFQPSDWELTSDDAAYNYVVIARLKPSATLAQARAELESLQNSYSLTARLPVRLGISLTPFASDVVSGISGALWLMFAAVGGVLLIACVNLANLQLARAVQAEREIAIRNALGASRAQLVWDRLFESLLLAVSGGVAGVVLAFTGVRVFIALAPANVPRLSEVQVNQPVLFFAAGLSIATAMCFGILPALRSLRVAPHTALLANTSRAVNSQEGNRIRNLLVAAEIACALVLLIVTSLALRSLSQLLRQNRGFDASHVMLAQVDLFAPRYDDALPDVKQVQLSFVDRARIALGQLPGVQSVAVTSAAPLTGETWVDLLKRPDHPLPKDQEPSANLRWIDENYLPTMQIPLVAGRNLSQADRQNPNVALISERTAREAFAGENPIGRTLTSLVPNDDHVVRVIGVVADTRINGLKDAAAMVYMPVWAYSPWTLSFLVRSSRPEKAILSDMQRVLWSIDPEIAIPLLKSMDEQVSDSVAADRFQAVVLTSFGSAALLLALLGVYGILAYSVSLRRQEFAIRIALGSGKAALVRLIFHQAAYPVLLGVSVGLGVAFVTARSVRSLLYQTPSLDPVALAGSVTLLLAAAALAALLPARRAASVDPMRALRDE